jgi:adenylosuccinate synthase
MVDLLRPQSLSGRLEEANEHYQQLCRGLGREPEVDFARLCDDLAAFGERMGGRIADVSQVLHRQMALGYSVLFEGAQATMLDIDHGSYPFVTSSSATAGGALIGLGVPPTRVDGVLGIAKAYTTRVGAGPLPSEIGGPLEESIRERGGEYGANTGRPRRCGWFDAAVVRYAVRVNGLDAIALTKLDVLDHLAEIRICTGYRFEGRELDDVPADPDVFERCEPVYETLPGWSEPTTRVRRFQELPAAAQRYVDRLSQAVGCDIGIVSTGPDRLDTIFRSSSPIAGWFE